MEANREAAKQCLNIATRAWADEDIKKALKFAQKSHDLFPGTASAAVIANAQRSEVNRDAAAQSLVVATRARNEGDLDKALRFANKSRDLCPSVVSTIMVQQLTGLQEQEKQQRMRENLRENKEKLSRDFEEIAREHKARMEEIDRQYKADMERHKVEREEIDRKYRHRHILRVTFHAWVKAKRDGIETPPEGAARVDPTELDQLFAELDVLNETCSTPNKELDLAMGQSSPTCVICAPEDVDACSVASSVVTQNEVAGDKRPQPRAPSSVATSAITLESTLHLRQRKGERGITRRELQSTLKHGEAERDPFTGRVLHRHHGVTFVTDAFSKVGITAWNENEEACKGRGCGREAECFRGFCASCCWGCDEHERCRAAGCTSEDVCIRGFCRRCCHGSSRCDCVPFW
jgi:hypothetical protein